MFLASLQSEDSSDGEKSDYNGYGLWQESPAQSGGNYGAWNVKAEPNLTPESFHSGILETVGAPAVPSGQAPGLAAVTATPLYQTNSVGSASSSQDHNTSSITQGSRPYIKSDESPELSLEPHELRELLADGSQEESRSGSTIGSTGSKVFKPKRERTSHNVIEKKYRTNINDKILQLRDIVPTLRVAAKRGAGIMLSPQDNEELDGLDPARKLNKASILVKTIEYIRHLEDKLETYKSENAKLRAGQGFTTPESDRHTTAGVSDFAPNLQMNPTQSTPYAQAYPSNSNNDMTSKLLMGGLALTMGASCFGEGNDYDTAKGLMSLPVFNYSPIHGFTVSNASGVISLPSAFLSLFRISLLLATAFHFLSMVKQRFSQGKDKTHDITVVPFADTVCFGASITDTLKKTMIINRLKYPVNSIERIESEIANCFALKIFDLKFPFNLFASRHINSTWLRVKQQVELANTRTHGALKNGIEWEMITNILASPREDTLGSDKLLATVSKKGPLTLKDFVQVVNDCLVAARNEDVVTALLEETSDLNNDVNETTERVFEAEVFNNSQLRLSSESFTMINCLFETTDNNIEALLKLAKASRSADGAGESPNNDQILILYSSIVRNLLANNQPKQACHWVSKIRPALLNANDVSLFGVAAVFLMMRSLSQKDFDEHYQPIMRKLEALSGNLRVWLGGSAGNCLDMELRGKLIDFCVETAMMCSSKSDKILDEETEVEDQDYEVSDDDDDDDDQVSS